MVPQRIYYLIEKFLDETLQGEETKELADWVEQADDTEIEELLKHAWQTGATRSQLPNEKSQRMLASIFGKQSHPAPFKKVTESISANRRYSLFKITAAAALIVMITSLSYIWLRRENKFIENKNKPVQELTKDVPPGGNKAILILSDGSQILLDGFSSGTLAQDKNGTVIKLANGRLAYKAGAKHPDRPLYNTLATPAGGQYQIRLPDGSNVWLNAASSIRFPTAFDGDERSVQITGEVYFEITSLYSGKNKIPFIVQIINAVENSEVEVLGTRFNVNAYGTEAVTKTTLLEGAVKIRNGKNTRVLSPGQQGQFNKNGEINLVKNIDVDKAVAWKNGYFQFENTELSAVLREAARWYDMEIVYQGDIQHERFTGKIERSVNLSRLLKWIAWSGVKCKVEGKKIIVMQ